MLLDYSLSLLPRVQPRPGWLWLNQLCSGAVKTVAGKSHPQPGAIIKEIALKWCDDCRQPTVDWNKHTPSTEKSEWKKNRKRANGELFKASLIMKSSGSLNPRPWRWLWRWRKPLPQSCRYLLVVFAQIGENENDKVPAELSLVASLDPVAGGIMAIIFVWNALHFSLLVVTKHTRTHRDDMSFVSCSRPSFMRSFCILFIFIFIRFPVFVVVAGEIL